MSRKPIQATKSDKPTTEVLSAPPQLRTVFLGGIFTLMLFAALHTASEIVIPFVLALVLKLVFQPLLRRLETWHVPRVLASFFIILALLSCLIGFGAALSGPAAVWGTKLPASFPQLQERLSFLRKPVEKTQKLLTQADDLGKPSTTTTTKTVAVEMEGSHLSDKIILGTQALAQGLFTTLLILLFMLAAGDKFLRHFVEILPRYRDKRQAVDISHQIEHDISRYLLTITGMNICVGMGAGLAMAVFQVDDPILWGALAFLLNYIPIIGPFIGISIFLLVGLMTIDHSWMSFAPAGLYVIIHILEGSFITPMLLAKRFTLNPVLVISSLIFWYWMWSIPGAILAMPMLAIIKIICDRIEHLAPLGHFLEG